MVFAGSVSLCLPVCGLDIPDAVCGVGLRVSGELRELLLVKLSINHEIRWRSEAAER